MTGSVEIAVWGAQVAFVAWRAWRAFNFPAAVAAAALAGWWGFWWLAGAPFALSVFAGKAGLAAAWFMALLPSVAALSARRRSPRTTPPGRGARRRNRDRGGR